MRDNFYELVSHGGKNTKVQYMNHIFINSVLQYAASCPGGTRWEHKR